MLVSVNIFIDASGAFAEVPPGREKFCAVTAAVIRSSLVPVLAERLAELRSSWDVGVEVKGSALNERQMSQAMRLFAAYDVTAVVSVIDTGQIRQNSLERSATDKLRRLRRRQRRN